MTVTRVGLHAGARRSDLESRTDVHDLVVAFSREVVFDPVLAPVFGEVAKVHAGRIATGLAKRLDVEWNQAAPADPGEP